MGSGGWRGKAGLAALAIVTCFALTWVAQIASGTGYPWYSSLNSGPSGSKLLFEVLHRSGRFSSVERNYLPQQQFRPMRSTVFYLGLTTYEFARADDSTLEGYERIAASGNRLILGVDATIFEVGEHVFDPRSAGGSADKKIFEVKRWEMSIRQEPGAKKGEVSYRIAFGPNWRQLETSGIWERRFGSGTVRVVNSPDRLSNEKLAKSESARTLVPLLVMGSGSIWFEEGHLGVIESGSIAGLMRRYRMHGVVAGCLLLTALLLWRNAAGFPPVGADTRESETVVIGSDTHGMMTGLLGRHVLPGQLMEVCVAEWNRAEPRRHLDGARWRGRDPVAAYREIAAELAAKRVRRS